MHIIFRKILRRSRHQPPSDQSRGMSTSFCQILGAARGRMWNLCEQLSLLNPTPIPTRGFGAGPSDSRLGGEWKLVYTTANDASFSKPRKRGMANTSQVIDVGEG